MKKYLYTIVVIMLLTSCKKFLDVKPQSQINESDLFTTEQGFREALNGVYTLCASPSLYGGDLTFTNDILSQNYQFNDVILQSTANFNYALTSVVAKNNNTWSAAYRAIANCNYILAAIDAKKGLFADKDYQLIKGETLALRAYLHFDILRMFGPSYKVGPNIKAIPYVTTVGVTSTPFSTTADAITKIIADLTAAKTLLMSDPIISSAYVIGYPSTVGSTETSSNDLFLQNRRHRLNYYAVCGELARVYLYKSDQVNSLASALEVINAKRFPFTDQDDFFNSDIQKKDRIFYKELIAAWYINTKAINSQLQSLYTVSNPLYSGTVDQVNDIYEVGQDGAEDWRYKQWFLSTAATTGGPNRAILQKYITNLDPEPNLHPLVAPAIRLSEMYYIAAEASYDTDPVKAIGYYNTIRAKRGIGNTLVDVPGKDEFINLLLAEARKEFYAENQIFYMYKRLNHAIVVSSTQNIQPSNNVFMFPLPQDELAYRTN
ncbi:RagB/SusD family nutrient uptake outer membrane protein [Mucilaginibacter flavus]|uniref:RagB/SusD family nutrient uptake outer membrane protein n=1 Tax=Mucilaginibacter flavus TaxID=931504 RepID=UPI0025B60049|nr:RagB/SusD family nutrient uptake outer membrane protein [Mucilaginibacter flavus]MDN3582404.1 RagB/SusD family nutrient uptake outer membrane protein [Mucilaginibacter flavus]